MDGDEKLTSARFFEPERLVQMRMSEDGVRIDAPSRKPLDHRKMLGAFLLGLALSVVIDCVLYTQGVVAHPKVQLVHAVNFVEDIFHQI